MIKKYMQHCGSSVVLFLYMALFVMFCVFVDVEIGVGQDVWVDPVTGMEFVWIPGGCFRMGRTNGYVNERPVHEVCVDGFWMGKYEVTQTQWGAVMGSNPSHFRGGRNPVENVSWNDTQDFIYRLNSRGNGLFRLPTEAEWEYAARSGGRDEIYSGGSDVDQVAWYIENSESKTHPVGGKAPNGFNLYDMSGNVWEWCQDWYVKDAYANHHGANPVSNDSVSGKRIVRGGNWACKAIYVRCALRARLSPDDRFGTNGFRIVRLLQE